MREEKKRKEKKIDATRLNRSVQPVPTLAFFSNVLQLAAIPRTVEEDRRAQKRGRTLAC
jgi:hypothetical protein